MLLGYSQKEAQRTTIREIEALYREYCHLNQIQLDDEKTIDDIIPI